MDKPTHFTLPEQEIRCIVSNKRSLEHSETDDILAHAAAPDECLDPAETNRLINGIGSPGFPEIQERVLDVAGDVRKCLYEGQVVPVAKIEAGISCSFDCDSCERREDSPGMAIARLSPDNVLAQAKHLIDKGIYSIELVCGDIGMVRVDFPKMIKGVRKLFPEGIKGKIHVRVMPLTTAQYELLKDAGADRIIMKQDSYDRGFFDKHVKSDSGRYGINDHWRTDKSGDGFTFRMQSQDRALEAGLEISAGTRLGLNPDLNSEVLATILHSRHLIERGGVGGSPLIVEMTALKKIPAPGTDMHASEMMDSKLISPYLAAVYFLSLPKGKAWVFPNLRVPMDTQIKALKAGGILTPILSGHEYDGKEYDDMFYRAGMKFVPETTIVPGSTLSNLDEMTRRRWCDTVSTEMTEFLLGNSMPPHPKSSRGDKDK
jgi:hypothetical protein